MKEMPLVTRDGPLCGSSDSREPRTASTPSRSMSSNDAWANGLRRTTSTPTDGERLPFSPLNHAKDWSLRHPTTYNSTPAKAPSTPQRKTILSPTKTPTKTPNFQSPSKTLLSPIGMSRKSRVDEVPHKASDETSPLVLAQNTWASNLRFDKENQKTTAAHPHKAAPVHANRHSMLRDTAESWDNAHTLDNLPPLEPSTIPPPVNLNFDNATTALFGTFLEDTERTADEPKRKMITINCALNMCTRYTSILTGVMPNAHVCATSFHKLGARSPKWSADIDSVIYSGPLRASALSPYPSTAILTALGELYIFEKGAHDQARTPMQLSPCTTLLHPNGGFRDLSAPGGIASQACLIVPLVDTRMEVEHVHSQILDYRLCSDSSTDNLRFAMALHKASNNIASGALGYTCVGSGGKWGVKHIWNQFSSKLFQGK